MAESTDPGATDQLAPDEGLSPSKRRTGRTRAGNVSYPSYSSYRASGLGSKDERKSTQVHEGSFGTVVATSMRGWRRTMEDAHCFIWDLHAPEQALPYSLQCVHTEGQDASGIEVDESGNVFDLCAVFDGHVNANVANYAAKNLSTVLLEEISRSLIKRTDIMEAERYVWDAKHVLEETFRQLDENYYKSVHIMCEADSSNTNANADEYAKAPNMQGGCTACVALITKKTIWVANAGDARAVYYSVPPLASTSTDLDLQPDESNVHPLSNDHKPSLPFERERINATGIHAVHKDGRIDGTLSVSRALGDYCFKNAPTLNWKEQAVTCFPDVMSFQRCATPGGVLCVACDGIWEEEPKAEQGKKQYFVGQCLTRAHMPHTVHRLDTDCENAQHAQDVPAQGQETPCNIGL